MRKHTFGKQRQRAVSRDAQSAKRSAFASDTAIAQHALRCASRLTLERHHRDALAIALEGALPPHEAAEVLADSYASLPLPERLIAAALVMPRLTNRRDLPAAALEPICNDWALVGTPGSGPVVSGQGTAWVRPILTNELPKLDARTEKGRVLLAVAAQLLYRKHEARIEALGEAWKRGVAALRPAGRRAAA